MNDRYYVRFRGRVLGPFTAEKTAEMVRRGQVTRVHELSPDGLSWKKAEDFTEFFGKANAVRVVATQSERQTKAEPVELQMAPTEAMQWHVHCDGQEYGPISEGVLQDWIRQGRVQANSMVWRTGMTDWSTAESVQPNWFAGQPKSPGERNRTESAAAHTSSGDDLDQQLLFETTNKLPWLYFISISIIIIGALSTIGAAIVFLQGVAVLNENRNLGTVRLVWGIMAGVQSIMTLLAGILLLRYTNTVSTLRMIPTVANAILAAKRLSAFWFLSAFYMLMLLTFVAFGILVEILAEATT